LGGESPVGLRKCRRPFSAAPDRLMRPGDSRSIRLPQHHSRLASPCDPSARRERTHAPFASLHDQPLCNAAGARIAAVRDLSNRVVSRIRPSSLTDQDINDIAVTCHQDQFDCSPPFSRRGPRSYRPRGRRYPTRNAPAIGFNRARPAGGYRTGIALKPLLLTTTPRLDLK
jgi:hypothetical protein